jgi:hypothetical protein
MIAHISRFTGLHRATRPLYEARQVQGQLHNGPSGAGRDDRQLPDKACFMRVLTLLAALAKNRCALGLSLIICGQPIAWTLRGILTSGENPVFPAAAVLLGVGLMLEWRWISNWQLHTDLRFVLTPLCLFLLPVSFIALGNPVELGVLGAYIFFLAGVVIVIALHETDDFAALPHFILASGFVSTVMPLVQLLVTGASKNFFRLTIVGNDNSILVADIAGLTALAALVILVQGRRNSMVFGLFIAMIFAVSLGVVVLTNTRSVMIFLVLDILFLVVVAISGLLARPGQPSGGRRHAGFVAGLLASAAAFPAAAILLLGADLAKSFVSRSWERVDGALAAAMGDQLSADASTTLRSDLVFYSWDRLTLLGHGMMAQQVDQGQGMYPHLSYLQAFYDFGLIGGLMYFFVILAVPATIMLRRLAMGNVAPTELLIMLMFILAQGDHLTHAPPYAWTSLVPPLLVLLLLSRTGDRVREPRLTPVAIR